jgi:hypothetical protein
LKTIVNKGDTPIIFKDRPENKADFVGKYFLNVFENKQQLVDRKLKYNKIY